MSYILKTNLSHPRNYGQARSKDPQWIVIHYTGNDGDHDESNARYFQGIRNASAHRFVDDDSITISVPDHMVAWSVGGDKYPSCPQTGGGKYHGRCTNVNSLSLELCDTVRNGVYDFTPATLENAALQVVEWMKRYKIDLDHVIRHFDVVGKTCPAPFVNNPTKWKLFKELVAMKLGSQDPKLSEAYRKINAKIPLSSMWGGLDTMKMGLVPSLLTKLGGIPHLVLMGVISDQELWASGKYKPSQVRDLLVKYSEKA